MNDLLLDKVKQTDLELFKFILFSTEGVSFFQIQQRFNFSQATCYRRLTQLEEDLLQCFSSDSSIQMIIRNDKTYAVYFDQSVGVNYYIERLRLMYIKQNTTFLILEALINKEYNSIEQLAADCHISVPTVYKKIARLQKLAKKLHIKLAVHAHAENIQGEETGIRFFYFFHPLEYLSHR